MLHVGGKFCSIYNLISELEIYVKSIHDVIKEYTAYPELYWASVV